MKTMNSFLIFSILIALTCARPSTILTSSPIFITSTGTGPLQSQYHAQDSLGQYSYGYSGGLSAKAETKTFDGITRGSYTYIDADGKLQSVEYTADSLNGFRAVATNIPQGPIDTNRAPEPVRDTPEVEKARAEHLAAFREAEIRAENASADEDATTTPQAQDDRSSASNEVNSSGRQQSQEQRQANNDENQNGDSGSSTATVDVGPASITAVRAIESPPAYSYSLRSSAPSYTYSISAPTYLTSPLTTLTTIPVTTINDNNAATRTLNEATAHILGQTIPIRHLKFIESSGNTEILPVAQSSY